MQNSQNSNPSFIVKLLGKVADALISEGTKIGVTLFTIAVVTFCGCSFTNIDMGGLDVLNIFKSQNRDSPENVNPTQIPEDNLTNNQSGNQNQYDVLCQYRAEAFSIAPGSRLDDYKHQTGHYMFLWLDGNTIEIGIINSAIEGYDYYSNYQAGEWYNIHDFNSYGNIVGHFEICYDQNGTYGFVY